MQVEYTPHFQSEFIKAPRIIQEKFQKQIKYLLRDIRHPSLHAKKFDEERDVWQARVDKHHRFNFQIRGDRYILLRIVKHRD